MGLSIRCRAVLGVAATGLLLLAVPPPARAQGWCDLQEDYTCNAPEYADGHCQQCSSRLDVCFFFTGCTLQGCPGDSQLLYEVACPSSPPGYMNKYCSRSRTQMLEYCALCQLGYNGPYCEYSNADTCNGHGTVNYIGQCACDPGFTGPNCCPEGWTGPGGCATDIDECLIDEGPCLNGGTCTNAPPGSYTCECVGPYTGADCEISDRIFMDGFEEPS